MGKDQKAQAEQDSSYDTLKKRIFQIIQIGNREDFPSRVFDIIITVVIVLNIAITFLLTFNFGRQYKDILENIELVTIIIFLVEYLLRIWTANRLYPDEKGIMAKLRYIFSFYGVIDLLTILPYFLPFVFLNGAVAFRMFRVVRIFHLFRINSHYDAFNVITEVLKDKKDQIFSSVFIILVLLMAASLCMFDLEHEAQPENFTNAFSGIWWAVSTLLTVGYGDIYPITVGGRLMAIAIAFLGVGVVAIPTGIISAGFVEYYTRFKSGENVSKEADFIDLEIEEGHPFVGKMIKELPLPAGLYIAVLVRGDDVNTPYPNFVIEAGDSILLGTTGKLKIDGKMQEVTIVNEHPWIDLRIKELNISRQQFVIMIKRDERNVRPQPDTIIRENDIVLIMEKKIAKSK